MSESINTKLAHAYVLMETNPAETKNIVQSLRRIPGTLAGPRGTGALRRGGGDGGRIDRAYS
jgi:hypothetical protein